MLVVNFVFKELTVKYPFVSKTPTLKDIEKEIIIVTTEWDSVGKKEYSSWQNLANYTNICFINTQQVYFRQMDLLQSKGDCRESIGHV